MSVSYKQRKSSKPVYEWSLQSTQCAQTRSMKTKADPQSKYIWQREQKIARKEVKRARSVLLTFEATVKRCRIS